MNVECKKEGEVCPNCLPTTANSYWVLWQSWSYEPGGWFCVERRVWIEWMLHTRTERDVICIVSYFSQLLQIPTGSCDNPGLMSLVNGSEQK